MARPAKQAQAYRHAGEQLDPVSGAEIAELVGRFYGTPPDILDLVRKINAAR
jgi:hypothetical protein